MWSRPIPLIAANTSFLPFGVLVWCPVRIGASTSLISSHIVCICPYVTSPLRCSTTSKLPMSGSWSQLLTASYLLGLSIISIWRMRRRANRFSGPAVLSPIFGVPLPAYTLPTQEYLMENSLEERSSPSRLSKGCFGKRAASFSESGRHMIFLPCSNGRESHKESS